MVRAFALALADTFAPAQRRPLLLSIGLALLLLAGLWIGATALVSGMHLTALPWLDTVIHVVGSLAALFVAWVLFPAMTMLMLGFFLDRVVAAIEAAHYPELPPARRIGIAESIGSLVRLAILAVIINLLLLPLYLVPVVGQVAYYGLNGWLVGREYFELVGLRRMASGEVRAMWRRHRGMLVAAGAVIAFLLTLPFVDLVAPLTGAAFMLHLLEGLRRRAP